MNLLQIYPEAVSERILKIGRHLGKLWACFLTHGVHVLGRVSMAVCRGTLQAGVHGVRSACARPADSQHRADVERHPEQQVAGRRQGDLRRREDTPSRAGTRHQAVHGVGGTRARGRPTSRRYAPTSRRRSEIFHDLSSDCLKTVLSLFQFCHKCSKSDILYWYFGVDASDLLAACSRVTWH